MNLPDWVIHCVVAVAYGLPDQIVSFLDRLRVRRAADVGSSINRRVNARKDRLIFRLREQANRSRTSRGISDRWMNGQGGSVGGCRDRRQMKSGSVESNIFASRREVSARLRASSNFSIRRNLLSIRLGCRSSRHYRFSKEFRDTHNETLARALSIIIFIRFGGLFNDGGEMESICS